MGTRKRVPAKNGASRTDGFRLVDFGLMFTQRPSLAGSIGAPVDFGLISLDRPSLSIAPGARRQGGSTCVLACKRKRS